ncbi:MAG: LysR family transcriptional regulator [Bdellovibrionaceae bacterium]|nr:LysR family transcriptional regulator [Pseudobdellovibrionaceae bacterium]
MLLKNINLNYLRVFECVYRRLCMTSAAKELHLTQSGVSQHIRALEECIDAPLFDRLHRKLMPTKEAQKLYFQTRLALKHIEEALGEISQTQVTLSGEVNIGTPIEFGIHKIIPALADLGKKYPDLKFNIALDFASKIQSQLLAGNLDFAFVDEFVSDRNIETQKVAEETLILCATQDYLKKFGPPKNRKSYFEELQYIAYQKDEPVLRRWFLHHTKRKNLTLNVRATVMDVQAIASFILQGLGAGILPGHFLESLKSQNVNLYNFPGSGTPLKNKISLAFLKGRQQSHLVKLVIGDLKEIIK